MAIIYKIKSFQTDPEDATKTLVGFTITNDKENILFIDKSVTTGSNTDAQLITAAQTAAQSEINAWTEEKEIVGKTWNPDTSELT